MQFEAVQVGRPHSLAFLNSSGSLTTLAAIRRARQGSEEIICYYQRPFIRLRSWLFRSLLCLFQRILPLLSGVALCLRKDSVRNPEVAVRCAVVACRVPGTRKLLRWGIADRAYESSHESQLLLLGREPRYGCAIKHCLALAVWRMDPN